MLALRRILCPIDFSEPSDRAFAYAVDLARGSGAEIELVHVYQPAIYALPDGAVLTPPQIVAKLTTELSRQLADRAARVEGVTVHTHLVEGSAAHEIVALAGRTGADLIVVGTHGRTGLRHLLIGSVAERVVRTAKVPVITVPDKH